MNNRNTKLEAINVDDIKVPNEANNRNLVKNLVYSQNI